MTRMFHVGHADIESIISTPFQDNHVEHDLQLWSEKCPEIINDGTPMLSLGMEITTGHGHSIDNLYLDGNGCIVAAELKRGKSPRDVTAQALDYAAFVEKLSWSDLENICSQKTGKQLDKAYSEFYGRELDKSGTPPHRLLIVAESFDDRVIDAATYLINSGIPLALVQFTYFEVGSEKLLQVDIPLGEIPDQSYRPANVIPQTESKVPERPEGLIEWVIHSLTERLPEIENESGFKVATRTSQNGIAFKPEHWPFGPSDCLVRVDVHIKSLTVAYNGYVVKLPWAAEELRAAARLGEAGLAEDRVKEGSYYASASLLFPLPEIGESNMIDKIVSSVVDLLKVADPISVKGAS